MIITMLSKRLYIDFGGKIVNLNETDIYLTDSQKLFSEKSEYSSNIFKMDFELLMQDESITHEVDYIFSHFDIDVEFLKNTFYSKGYLHLRSLIEQIAVLISKNEISALVLDGGCKTCIYGFHYGEGEARSRFFKREYFYNYFIYHCFKDVFKIIWRRKDSYVLLNLFRTLRNIIMPTSFILLNSYRSLIKRLKRDYFSDKKSIKNVIIVDMETQYSFLKNKEFSNYSIISHRFLNIKNSEKLEFIHFFDLLKLIFNTKTVYFHRDFDIEIDILTKNITLKLSVSEILRSLLFCYVSFNVRKSQIKYLLSKERYKSVTKLITAMTYDIDISSVNHVAIELNLVHDNYQAVTNRRVCYPVLELASNYYLNDITTYNFYKNKSASFRYLAPKFRVIPSRKNIDNCINAVFFAQPDSWADTSIAELKELCSEIERCKFNISLTLKLHYRQNKIEEFLIIVKRYKFLKISDISISATDLLKSSDLGFGLTSSVLYEAILLGCMSCILNTKKNYCVENYSSSICPEVNFVITERRQLKSLLLEYSKSYNEYYNRRSQYITEVRTFATVKAE